MRYCGQICHLVNILNFKITTPRKVAINFQLLNYILASLKSRSYNKTVLQLRHPQRLPYISHCDSWWKRQKIQSVSSSFSPRLRRSLQNFPSPSNDATGYAGCVNNRLIQDYTFPGDHIPPYLWQDNCVQTILYAIVWQ